MLDWFGRQVRELQLRNLTFRIWKTTHGEPESAEKIPTFVSTTTDRRLPSLHSLHSASTKRTDRPLMALKTTRTAEETKRIGPERERKELRELRAQETMRKPCKHQAGLLPSMRATPTVIGAGGGDWKNGEERTMRTTQWTSTGSPHEVRRAAQTQRGLMLTLLAQTIRYRRARQMSTRSSKSAGPSLRPPSPSEHEPPPATPFVRQTERVRSPLRTIQAQGTPSQNSSAQVRTPRPTMPAAAHDP